MLYTGSNQKHLFLGKYISIHNIHQGNIYFLMLIQVSVSAQTTTTLKLRKHSILKFIGTVKKHSCNVGDGQWGGAELQGGILVWVLNGISLLPILLDTLAPKTTGVTPIWTKKKKKDHQLQPDRIQLGMGNKVKKKFCRQGRHKLSLWTFWTWMLSRCYMCKITNLPKLEDIFLQVHFCTVFLKLILHSFFFPSI